MEFKLNTNRVSKYYKLTSMGQTARAELLAPEDKLHKNTIPLVNNAYIYGIEIEVEDVRAPIINYDKQPYWNITTDNSLRNNGVEFVSLPLTCNQIEYAMDQLNVSLPTTATFGPRTSTHIHMNVRDLTIDQITCLILLYTSVENLLFNWVGHERDQNIFCIKITETEYIQNLIAFQSTPNEVVHYWNKYTALNILPIESKGTVEFRHLHGTRDKERLIQWINFLSCLKMKAKSSISSDIFQQIQQLNTNSDYEYYVSSLFHGHTDLLLQCTPNLKEAMEEAISYIKLAAIYQQPQETQQGNQFTLQVETVANEQQTTRIGNYTRTIGEMLDDIRIRDTLRTVEQRLMEEPTTGLHPARR